MNRAKKPSGVKTLIRPESGRLSYPEKAAGSAAYQLLSASPNCASFYALSQRQKPGPQS